MIKEEYNFSEVADYLYDSVDILIAGIPREEERSKFFSNEWISRKKIVLHMQYDMNGKVQIELSQPNSPTVKKSFDICEGTPRFFKDQRIDEKSVLLDLSSLDHVLIMYLTKVLLKEVAPVSLFAAYIRPKEYILQSGDIGFSLCEQVSGVRPVPGFTKREPDRQTFCAFLGFEANRLKSVIDSTKIDKFIPIVPFPSGNLQWYNVTMWNSMNIIESENKEHSIYKCPSESIFDAVALLRESLSDEEKIVIAPLGTRPHSMASAIFACQRKGVRIVYDNAIEHQHRSKGIGYITVYHLSSFIQK